MHLPLIIRRSRRPGLPLASGARRRPGGPLRGISILEVLVSMFILLFGLVYIAMLFPVGSYHAARANRYDRAAAVGQRAFHEVTIRGYMNPAVWKRVDGATPLVANVNNFRGRTFAIDPFGITELQRNNLQGMSNANSSFFPCSHASVAGATSQTAVDIRRVSIATPDGGWYSQPLARSIFQARDDLSVEFPADRSRPSTLKLNNNSTAPAYEGDFSWMFMVSPTSVVNYGTVPAPLLTDQQEGDPFYTVSVVVFYKRDVTQEWTLAVPAADMGTGNAGGTLLLRSTTPLERERLRSLTSGEWVLISRPAATPPFHKWYRIASTSKITATGIRRITLHGADNALNTVGCNVSSFGTAVAVYEKTMQVQSSGNWQYP